MNKCVSCIRYLNGLSAREYRPVTDLLKNIRMLIEAKKAKSLQSGYRGYS